LEPCAYTVAVAEQVLTGQDQLERRICQGACSGRGARDVLRTGGSRHPTEERKDGDGDARPADHRERFPDLGATARARLAPKACAGNRGIIQTHI